MLSLCFFLSLLYVIYLHYVMISAELDDIHNSPLKGFIFSSHFSQDRWKSSHLIIWLMSCMWMI